MQMRMVKSAEEIAFITNGAAVCDIGGAALVAAVKEGVPEYEVALASIASHGCAKSHAAVRTPN